MKKIFIAVALVTSITAAAQKKPVPAKKPVTPHPALKTMVDSASYAIGVSVASFYKQQGMKQLNTAMVSKAIADVLGNKKVLLNDQQCNDIIMSYINQAQTAKSKPTIAAGEAFLAKNKLRTEVKTTASGLQYEVLREGTGPKPAATDSVTVHYAGTLINGTEFDNSYKRGEPITFPLNGVIAGWTEGVQLMSVGSKYKLYVPHQLAYGTRDVGQIPAGSVLVFEVELLAIPGKQ